MNIKKSTDEIIMLLGGKENIISLTHCITRLRFKIDDTSKIDINEVKKVNGVISVIVAGGQHQVVIGNNVGKFFKQIENEYNFENKKDEDCNLFNKCIDTISGTFTTILGVLAASGMIKGFMALFLAINIISAESMTYQIFVGFGDALFKFMPIMLGYSAMKKFGANPVLGATLGAIITYPLITQLANSESLYTLFDSTIISQEVKANFLGLPLIIPMGGYETTVLPIIAMSYFASKLEKICDDKIPKSLSLFFTPLFVIIIIASLGLLIIGPILNTISELLMLFMSSLIEFSPIIYGLVLGLSWQVLVMFGLHWAVIPLMFLELSSGSIPLRIMAPVFGVGFAQVGAVLAVYVRTNDHKTKSLCIPSVISGIFGITESAIYGITLPLKIPFIASCFAGAIVGAVSMLGKSFAYSSGGLGIFTLPSLINPQGIDMGFYTALIVMPLAIFLGYVFTNIGYKLKKEKI